MPLDVRGRYGSEIFFRDCVLGPNLNLFAIRGFARIDLLSAISAPDVFDQEINPQGTQRELKRSHSEEALDYALAATQVAPDQSPRAFTEVILNVRDRNCVSIFSSDSNEEIEFKSTETEEGVRVVDVRVDLGAMTFPQPLVSPQISRVDGNHRLSAVFDNLELLEDPELLPVVPFCLFVGLSIDQERALFRDINGNQMKMETAHLNTITLKLTDPVHLLADPDITKTALWIAHELSQPSKVFENMVFFGGARRGLKQNKREIPPLKINALRDSVKLTITGSTELEQNFFTRDLIRDQGLTPEQIEEERLQKAKQFVVLIDRYWRSVKNAYPQAWQDRRGYILLQSIGMYAFSWLAGVVIPQQIEDRRFQQSDFDVVLASVSRRVDLSKTAPQWQGIAGLAGARMVFKSLKESLDYKTVRYDELAELTERAAGPLDAE